MWIELQPIYTTVSTRFTDQYNISDQTKHHRGAGSRNLAVMVNAAISWCMSPKYLASIYRRYDSSFQTMHCAFHDSQMPKQLSCLLGALNRHPNGLWPFPGSAAWLIESGAPRRINTVKVLPWSPISWTNMIPAWQSASTRRHAFRWDGKRSSDQAIGENALLSCYTSILGLGYKHHDVVIELITLRMNAPLPLLYTSGPNSRHLSARCVLWNPLIGTSQSSVAGKRWPFWNVPRRPSPLSELLR